MKRLFQFASSVLMLLMLAPPAFASMQCGRNPETHKCLRTCCDEMDGMSKPMDQSSMDSGSGAQLSQSTCCAVTQGEISQPASFASNHAVNSIARAALPAVLLPVELHPVHTRLAEFPPGATLLEPVLSRLCIFQI